MCRVPYDNIIYKHSYVKLKLGLLDEKKTFYHRLSVKYLNRL